MKTTVGIEFPENILDHFAIGPNPVQYIAQIHMRLSQPSKVKFDRIDALGQLVQSIDSVVYSQEEHTLLWNTSHLASGMYLVRASTATHASYFKVIK